MIHSTVRQLQLVQQNLQTIISQKQQIEDQLMELNSALAELQKTEKAYRILSGIMLAASARELQEELTEKKERASLRLKNFSRQEGNLRQTMEGLQKKMVEELKEK